MPKTSKQIVGHSDKPLKAPFGYYGCKQRLSSRIVATLPPHNAWVEALCGSAAVTLAKKPALIEVINDIHGEIINFFRQLRDNTAELRRQISLTPYARQELELARRPVENLSEIERARRFFVMAMMAINGSFGEGKGGFSFSNSYTRSGREARVSRWNASADHLERVAARLSRVRIENKDALVLFKDFADRPATLVYFDPPYLGDRIRGYDFDQNSIDYHEQLLKSVVKAKCMIFISGYHNELYERYLSAAKGWRNRVIETTTRGHNGKNAEREEVIWFNGAYHKALESGRIPIRFSVDEKRYKKVNPKR
jgi:DNA adenine methylase